MQRKFTTCCIDEYGAATDQSSKAAQIVRLYVASQMVHHLKGALVVPLHSDEIARRILFLHEDIVDQVSNRMVHAAYM